MSQRIIRSFFLFAISLILASPTFAQTATAHVGSADAYLHSWQVAQSIGSSKRKLIVVTRDQPNRRHSCHVQYFTAGELVCSHIFGGSRTYRSQQILALILPGDNAMRVKLLLGLNGGLAAAIWGTVVLAATCPPCAVATGIAALLIFGAAGAICIGDGQPERILFLAAGQHLTGKLRSIQPATRP